MLITLETLNHLNSANKFPVKEYTGTKNHMITGIKVQSIGEGDYFGFELDGNHRFLLGDCTVMEINM
jgi:hypothetical protein